MHAERRSYLLPVWTTAKTSYRLLFKNSGIALRLAIIPMAVTCIPFLLMSHFWSGLTLEEAAVRLDRTAGYSVLFFVIVYLPLVISIPAITAWHRLAVLGPDSSRAHIRYQISKAEWQYLLAFLKSLFIVMLPLVFVAVLTQYGFIRAIYAMSSIDVRSAWWNRVWDGLHIVFILLFYSRVCLVFPAAALGDKIGFFESWSLTIGNTWRLLAVSLLTVGPVQIVLYAINYWTVGHVSYDDSQPFAPFEDELLSTVIALPFGIASLYLWTSIWSWPYCHFVQGEDIVLPGERSAG